MNTRKFLTGEANGKADQGLAGNVSARCFYMSKNVTSHLNVPHCITYI